MSELYELRANFIESRDDQSSPSSVVSDEGFEQGGDLLFADCAGGVGQLRITASSCR